VSAFYFRAVLNVGCGDDNGASALSGIQAIVYPTVRRHRGDSTESEGDDD
jgi:hypothetical protein